MKIKLFTAVFISFFLSSCAPSSSHQILNFLGFEKPIIFEFIYMGEDGIFIGNTQKPTVKKLISLESYNVQGKVSPNNKWLCLSYPVNDTIQLSLISLVDYQIKIINSFPQFWDGVGEKYFTDFEWSPDSKIILYSYFKEKPKNLELYDGDIQLYNIATNKSVSIGCTYSKLINSFINDSLVIVGNRNSRYTTDSYLVNINNCKKIYSFGNIENISVSPSKKLILYKNDQEYYLYRVKNDEEEKIVLSNADIDLNNINHINWISESSILFEWKTAFCVIDFNDNNSFSFYMRPYSKLYKTSHLQSPLVSPNKNYLAYFSKIITQMPGSYPSATIYIIVEDMIGNNESKALHENKYIVVIPKIITDQINWISADYLWQYEMDFKGKKNYFRIYSISKTKKKRYSYSALNSALSWQSSSLAFDVIDRECLIYSSDILPNPPLAIKVVE